MNSCYTIWSPQGADQILRGKTYECEPLRSMRIGTYANASAGFRLILTAKRTIDTVDIEIPVPPRRADGKELPVAVRIYSALYYPLQTPSAGTTAEAGEYPNALLPLKVANAYNMTAVEPGKNAEYRLDFTIARDAEPGEYSASVVVGANGGDVQTFTLTFEVWDYCLPRENHTRQLFILDPGQLRHGEGTGWYEKYYKELLDYRINCPRLPVPKDAFEDSAAFVGSVRKYFDDEHVSLFEVPVSYNADYTAIDVSQTEETLDLLTAACFEDGKNYYRKAVTYIWIIDEPHLSPERMRRAQVELPRFEALRRRAAEKAKARGGDLAEEVSASISALPNIVTCGAHADLLPKSEEEYKITFCPAFPPQDEGRRAWHALNRGEKWWYGCDWPVPPAPTYHIDDSTVSPRLLSWMQYAEGVTGNLYWRLNHWFPKKDGQFGTNDPYRASAYRGTHGEGCLIYPGRSRFGIPHFVPSVRLMAIRDGIEDYEAMYALGGFLRKNAEKRGVGGAGATEILRPLLSRLFDNNRIVYPISVPMDEAKARLAGLLLAAKNFGLTVTDAGDGKWRFLADGKVSAEGAALTREADGTYVLTGDEGTIVFGEGESALRVPVFLRAVPRPVNYALANCWGETEKKLGVALDAPNIVAPYYRLLDEASGEALYTAAKDLSRLVTLVWKTETGIEKRTAGGKTEVVLYVPAGAEARVEGEEERSERNGCLVIRAATEGKKVALTVKNEKGEFSTELYL